MIRTFLQMMKKELLQIVRTKATLVVLLVCPVVAVGLVPFGLGNQVRLRLEIVDQTLSDAGRQAVRALAASPHVKTVGLVRSREEAFSHIHDGSIDAVMILQGLEGPDVIFADGTNLLQAGNVANYLRAILQPENTLPMPVREHLLFVSCGDNTHYFIVSMAVLLLSIVGGVLSCLSVVGERDKKVLEHLRSMGVSSSFYVFSKLFFFVALCLVELSAGLLLGHFIFGLEPLGSLFAVYLIFALFAFVMVSLGMAIAAWCKTLVQSIYVMVFLYLMLILLSTMFAPLDYMSDAWALSRYVNPFYWIIDGGGKVILKGYGLSRILEHMGLLLLMGSLLCSLAIARLRRVD